MILKIFLRSFQDAARHWRWALIWTVPNFLLALCLFLPFGWFLRQVNGHSLMAERLEQPGLDLLWLMGAIHQDIAFQKLGTFVSLTFLGFVTLYLLFVIFLTGGTIALFHPGEPKAVPRPGFWRGCLHHYPTLFRATALMGVVYGLLFLVGLVLTGKYLSLAETAATETTVNQVKILLTVFLAIGVGAVTCLSDYLKVGLVLTNRRQVLQQLAETLVFFKQRGGTALLLFSMTSLTAFLLFGVTTWLATAVPQSNWVGVAGAFLVQQAALFGRNWVRLACYAGEAHLLAPMISSSEQEPDESSSFASQNS
ncbi:MAG: hypothetical protein K1Y36_02605 [Blastocatellia bacterium]|nr:hypothetical protein [Blastocatellia bacterium]